MTVSSGVTPLESKGFGKTDYNGNLLLSICTEHKLVIMNTIFRQSDKYKTTWKQPRSNHWHLLYYIIVRAQDQTDVNMTRTLRGADSWIDHRLVRSKMTLRLLLRSRKQSKKWRRRFNIKALQNPATCESLQHHLIENLSILPVDTNDTCAYWQALKTASYKACTDSIGYATHQHQDWFDENNVEIQVLLHRKRTAFCVW